MSNDPARLIAQSARTFTDPAERAAYLDRVCRGIARLRADVERHLAEMESGAAPAAVPEPEPEPAPAVVAPLAAPEPVAVAESPDVGNEKAGDRIGRYLLVKQLGEGGFGTVWKAEQTEPVKRTVALKIIKLGMDTEQVVVRFGQERQALALMDHPHVARVLDAGATSRGRPYFVMDLVQGVPIGEFCDAGRLTVAARLELFAQVCAAVQHAHMRGIIHRDLKPSNILVAERDGKPHATVIDFGIAKATSSKLTDRSMVTEAYQVIGTLQYMSPEQSQASPDIDTRTDVYSLGVILYELLTGTTPYDQETFQRAVLSEILRMIGEADPPPPSAKITETRDALPRIAESRSSDARRLATALRGELDWIVLKAIEKDRDRRYESAEAFAADVRRYLAGDEVSAAPPSAAYRMRKFVRRHRRSVAAAAAVAASLVAGIVAFAWKAGEARRERDDAIEARRTADVERSRAESVATFMESVFEGIDPDEQSSRSGSLKDQILARLEGVSGEFARMEGDPVGRARLQMALARPLYSLSQYEKAMALCREAIAARTQHLGEADPRTEEAEFTLASVCRHAGRFDESLAIVERLRDRRMARGALGNEAANEIDVALAETHDAAGRIDRAIEFYEAVHRRVLAEGGPDTKWRLFALHGLGAAYRKAGRMDEAISVLSDLLARRTALLGEDHTETQLTANSLAVAYATAKRYDEARKLYESAYASFARRYPPDHPYVMHARMNIAGTLRETGKLDEALKIAQEESARALARFGPAALDTVQIRYGLAVMLSQAKRHAEACAVFEPLIEPMDRLWGAADPVVTAARAEYLRASAWAGRQAKAVKLLSAEAARIEADPALGGADGAPALLLRTDIARFRIEAGEGAALAAEVLALEGRAEKALGPRHAVTLAAMHEVGRTLFASGKAQEAIDWLGRVAALRSEVLGADHREAIASAHLHGSAHWLAKSYDRAVALLEDALSRASRSLGPDDTETLTTALDLGTNLYEAGRREDYLRTMAEWLPRAQAAIGMDDANVAGACDAFFSACAELDRADLAGPVLDRVAEHCTSKDGPDSPDALGSRANAASAWFAAGQTDRALAILEDVVPRMRRVFGPGEQPTLLASGSLAVNYRVAGRVDEAIRLFEDTLRIAREGGERTASETAFLEKEYLGALAVAGRSAEVSALSATYIAAARKRFAPGGLSLAGEFGSIAPVLLDAKLYAEAEPVLREMVTIREKLAPDLWNHFNARALVGEALLCQKRYAEAEPFVVSGCEGLLAREAKVPRIAQHWVPKARERVLRLYAEWDAAEPGRGHDAHLAEWKAKLAPAPSGNR